MRILVLVIAVVSLAGCYSKSQLNVAVERARVEACAEKDAEIAEKTSRLRLFNQVNPDGSLR